MPDLGIFIGRDSWGYISGQSLYAAYFVPGQVDPTGHAPCDASLCEMIARFIDVIARGSDGFQEFRIKLDRNATETGRNLAKHYTNNTGCDDKGQDLRSAEKGEIGPGCYPCCHGFNDNVKFNGADNLRHFAGVMRFGRIGQDIIEGDDGAQLRREAEKLQKARQKNAYEEIWKITRRINEIESELVADRLAGDAYESVLMNRETPGQAWRRLYC
jgi:hypothetical protein